MEVFSCLSLCKLGQSGSYALGYDTELLSRITDLNTDNAHFIIDENVAAIYANEMSDIVKDKNTILIEQLNKISRLREL